MTAKIWGRMSHNEKVAFIKSGRTSGLSDEQIGDTCGATKGQVVGYRHRHVPELTGKERSVSTESDESTKEKPHKKSSSRKPGRVVILAEPSERPKLAVSEALQCTRTSPDDGQRCGFAFVDPITRRCAKHPL